MKSYKKALLTKRILAMAAAASLFVAPSITHSQNITKSDSSKANTVKVNGRVTNVTPDKTVNGGKTAINKFANFDLDKGNIANLHLEKSDTLVNFVDSKANINGIVNAVKNNRIDGNLYFLSSKGIAVGAQGAINAGKVGLITPNESTYNSLLNSDTLSDSTFSGEALDKIPLNVDGSISIAGNINAAGGITLAAQNIDIKAGAKLLNTNSIDYSSLVNTTGEDGSAVTAGLDSNLTLTKDDNGGIYISAKVDNAAISQTTNLLDQIGIDFTRFSADPLTAEVKVGEGATLTSDADVNIKASLTSTHKYDNTAPLTAAYGFKTNLDIAGTIQAKNISLNSTLTEDYTRLSDVNSDENKASSEFDITMLNNLFSLLNVSNLLQDYGGLANGYLLRSNSAALTIGDKASLNASKIAINANSTINAKLKGTGVSNSDSGAAAFNFGLIANSADLNIKGKVTSKGDLDITSKAGANIDESAKIDIKKDKNTAATIAGNFLTGASEANLKIAGSANIEAGGEFKIASTATSPVSLESVVNKEGSGLGALVLNFDQFDSKANLDVGTNLKAGGNVSINADFSAPTFKVTSEIATNNPSTDATQSTEEAKKTQQAGEEVNKLSGGGSNTTGGGSNIAANASIVMADNASSLAIKDVEASGDLSVSSSNVIADPQVGAISLVAAEPAGTTVSPVITYTNIKNNTNIDLKGDLNANKIEINNTLKVDAPRLEQAKKDVLSLKDKLSNAYKGLINKVKNTDSSEALDEANERLDNFLKDLESSDGDAMKALTGSANEILKDLKDYFASDPDVKDAIDTLERVTDATQVSNFYADKETVSTDKSGKANFSLAATALVNMMDNTSTIKTADGIALNARSGGLNVDSTLKNVGFSVSGHILPKSLDTSAIDAVVGVNLINDSNTTTLGKNVKLTGGSIALNADNKINHLVLNDGSGKGANSSYQAAGTVSYAGGGSTADIKIGAAPTITATDAFKVNANNDTNLFNVAGGLSYGSGAGSVGIGVAVNDFDVNTKANVGTTGSTGNLNAVTADVKATTDGMVNSLSVAGSLAIPSSSGNYVEKTDEEATTSIATNAATSTSTSTSTESLGIPLLDNFSSFLQSNSVMKIAEIAGKIKKSVDTTKSKISDVQSTVTGGNKGDGKVASISETTGGDDQPSLTFDGAGSASVNLGSRSTQATLDGLNVTNLTTTGLNATDKNFTGAWSGAGALNFRGGNSTSVAMAGAVAVNNVDSTVLSEVAKVDNLTGSFSNTANKEGALIAAGIGLAVSTSSGSNYTGAASASVNLADNSVKSSLKDNTFKGTTLTNKAVNRDTQITGGVNLSVGTGSGGAAMGGSAVWSDISNKVYSDLNGGTYTVNDAFNNLTRTTLTDITGAAGVAVSTGGYGVQGILAYNKIANDARANVKNASITAKSFTNNAYDEVTDNDYNSVATDAGLDVTGDSYTKFAKVGEVDSTQETIENKAEGKDGVKADDSVGYDSSKFGNTIVTGGIAVAGSSKSAAQAAVVIADVDNDFKAEVTGSTINTTGDVNINAKSNTLSVNAAAGAAVSGSGFGAGGSVSWFTSDNEVVAGFDGGTSKKALNADAINITTGNKALEVNVGGQVSGGSGVAAGLAMAYNALNDNTESYFKAATLDKASTLGLSANSAGKVYAVGAGVAASASSAALNGSVAVNRGSNSTSAAIEGVTGNSVKSVDVNVSDDVRKVAVVGGLTVSGGSVAVGGSVAYNDVGTTANKQLTKASIKDSTLNATGGLNVDVKDNSDLLTVGVGVSGSGSVAVQGAAAVATLNKDVGVNLDNSTIKGSKAALNANTTENLITTADVLAVSGTAAIGAGVSINNDFTKTAITASKTNFNLSDTLSSTAANSSKVLTVGIGGSASGSGAAVTGSVAVNNLNTTTGNTFKNANVEAAKGVSIISKGDEAIANYGGNLALTGSGAAVGLSVSVNNINSEVATKVNGTTFKNVGNDGAISVADTVDDSAIRNKVVDKDTFNSTTALRDSRKNTTYKGILIDASATHDIKSALFNVGATGTGAAVNGTVNINRVNGSTTATTKDSTFNTKGDVNVVAHDYTNTSGLVGTGSLALTGAGVGIGSDSAVLNRSTVATLDGNGVAGSLNAKGVKVDATGKQGVGSLVAGIAFAAEGAGLSNGVAVDLMSGKAAATLSDVKGSVGSLDVASNQKTNLSTVGVSAGLNLMGAGVGLSVDVINNKADTTTNVKGAGLEVTGTTNVKSSTDTSIDYELYDVGAAAVGGGVAGAVAVANNTAKTTTEVSNSTIDTKGSSANYTSDNSLTFKDRAVVGGVAGLGGGVGVGVTINTIDSSVNTNINGTVKSSGDLNISANESRNVKQVAAALSAGAGAASANVMITNVGKALENSYDSDLNNEDDGAHVSTSEEIDKANDAASNSKFGGDEISVGGMNVGLVKDSEKRVTMGGSKESGTHIKVGGTVEAKNININNTATNNITQEGLTGSAGGVSVNGAVGLVNLERNATSTLSGTFNATNKMTVNSTTDGTTTLDIKQGSAAGLLAANVSYADLTTSGVNAINVSGAKVKAAKELSINTDDTSTSKVNSIGVAVSATAAVGVLIADSTLESGNSINFTKATVEAPSINITAGGSPTAAVEAIAANGGALGAGTGLFAGTTNATTNSLNADANTTFTAVGDNGAGTVNFSAINGSKVGTKTGSVTGSIGVSGSVTAIKNVSNAAANIDVKATVIGNRKSTAVTTKIKINKTTYYAEFDSSDSHLYDYFNNNPNVIIEDKSDSSGIYTHYKLSSKSKIIKPSGVSNFKTSSKSETMVTGTKTTTTYDGNNPIVTLTAKAAPVQNVGLVSIGAGGLLAATGAVASVQSNVNANVNANFSSINAEALTINTTAENTPDIDVKGLTVGAIATGSNLIKANRNITAGSTLGGGVNVDTITINTTTSSTPDLYANGDGGGLVGISPAAAVIDDVVNANSTTTLKGKIDVRDDLNIKSINTDGGKVKADALGAAVIGGSGVSLNRNVNNNAAINIDSATITTGKSQTYTATNTLASNTDLEAAGYGGLNATAGGLTDKTNYKSNINVSNNAVLSSSGDITFTANTDGEAKMLNNLKAAGAIEVVVSESDVNTTFDNAINISDSRIAAGGNVAAAAYDRTAQSYHTIANIQGGAAGVAGAEETNTLNRSNSINLVGSSINADSLNLNSGYDSENVAGKLTLTTFADVYNKTALPLKTAPEMKNNLSVNNHINLDSSSNIRTIRDVNLKAESGTELVTESAKEYNIYTNESGKGRVTVTTGHEGNPNENQTIYANIDGNIETGIHNSLVVNLNGESSIEKGKEVNNIAVEVTKGKDFFNPDTIDLNSKTMVYNPYLEDYNTALADMQRYTPGTAEYNQLKAQAEGIAKVMAQYGFAEEILDSKGKGTGNYATYESLSGPAIELPNISVAGGNVDISTSEVRGSGKITANPANELTINNATNKTLLVNDLVMDNAGGKVYVNDVMKTGKLGNINLTTAASITSKVNINNTGKAYKVNQTTTSAAYTKAPDIVVSGRVNNSAGEVNIKNQNGSVLVNGQVYSMTTTKIETPNGGTVIDNTGGLQNVGSDPMHKWTFGNKKFAEELQTYVGTHNTNINFSTYDEYLRWLWNDVSISWDRCNELSGLTGRNYNVDTWIKAMKAKYDNNTAESSSSIVAGGAVSVIAKTLNVNGLIQSGFNNYTATTSQERARSIYKRQEQTYHNYKDEEVLGKAEFRVNDTDDDLTYNSKTGMYDKVVGLYYNPKTWHIIHEPISVTGGVVYLKATDLISTGNGKIVAAGGGANVNITNNIETKVTGKRGVINDVVRISDFIVKDINTISRGDPLILINGTDYTKASEYKPNSKAVYGWTGAINYNTIYTKKAYAISLFWGNWDIYKTDDLVSKLNKEKISINTTDSSTQNGKVVDPGVFTNLSGNGSLFSINTNRYQSGSVVRGKTAINSYYNTWYEKLAGVKTYEYTWTETQPNYANTTYRLNAAQPISIVTSNKKDITVNINNQTPDTEVNLIIDGDLNLTGNSTINLNSHGTIRTQSGSLTAKNINLTTTAGTTNIDATIGTMLNNAATNLNVTANGSGTMNLKSNAKLENLNIVGSKADLNLTAGDLVSGKVITTGNVNIKSEDKIDITGNIGGTVNLTGNAGVKADVTGDLKIGKIESTGAVELKASGAIVNSVDKAVAMTGSAEKLQSWYDAGLISGSDSDDSSSNAAENEKAVRLKSLENLFRRWALRDEDSTETVKTYTLSFSTYLSGALDKFLDAHPEITVVKRESRADHYTHSYIYDVILKSDYTFTLPDSLTTYEEVENHSEETITYKAGTVDYGIYNKLINHTADTKDFTTEQLGQYNLYQELKTSKDYGYSKNDLLYAIQEGILNPQAGLTANVPDPIITGKSVSLTAATIGKDLSPVTYKTLTDKTTLSKLAGAKMGDVTFNSNGTITMNEQSPVTIDLLDSNAMTSITTKGKTYIAGTTRTALNINTDINVPDDKVVLMTGSGITDDGLLSAKQLELYAGGGDLKASNVAVGSGGLVANALHDININGGTGGASLSKDGTFTLPTGSNLSDYTFNNKDYTTWLTSYAKGNGTVWNQFLQGDQATFRNYEIYLNFVYRGLVNGKRSDILTNIAGSSDWYTFTGKNWGEYHNSYARFREMMMPKYSGSNNLSIKNVTAGDTVTITNNGKITATSSDAKVKATNNINLTTNGNQTTYKASFESSWLGYVSGYLKTIPGLVSVDSVRVGGSDRAPIYKYTIQSTTPIPQSEHYSVGTWKTSTIIKEGDIGTKTTPLYLDTLNSNVNVGTATAYLTGDYRYLTLKDASNDFTDQKQYYNLTTKDGGDYTLNTKKFINATNNKNNSYTIRSIGDLNLGNILGNTVSLRAGGNLVGSDISSEILNVRNLNMSGNNTENLKTTASSVTASLIGTLDLKYTGNSAFNLNSAKDLKIKNLDAGSHAANITVNGNYTTAGTKDNIISSKLNMTATGDITLNNPSIRSQDTYTAENINITTTTNGQGKSYHDNNNLNAANVKRVEDPSDVYFKLNNYTADPIDLNTDKHITINAPDRVIKVAADRDIDITVTSNLFMDVTNSNHNTNIDGGQNSLWLFTSDNNNLKGTINANGGLALGSDGDIDLTTDSHISLMKGNNIKIKTDKRTVSDFKGLLITYNNSILVDTPTEVYFGSKNSDPTFNVKTGSKEVTIEAANNFNLTTDNLNLKGAEVVDKLKVTSTKDITGKINAGEVDLTAKGNVKVTSDKDITGVISAKTTDLTTAEAITITDASNIGEVKNLTAEQVTIKKANLDTLDNVNAYRSAINATTANVYNKTSLNDSSAVYLYRTYDTTISAKDNVKYNIDTTKNLTVKGNNTKLGLSSAGEKFTFNGDTLTADEIAAKNIDLTATGDVTIDKLSMLGDYYYIDANNQWVSTDNNKYLRNHTELEVVSRRLSGRTWYYTLRSESPITRFNQSNITNRYEGTGERWKVFKAQGTKINDGKLNANVKGNLNVKSTGLVDLGSVEVGKNLTIEAWNIAGEASAKNLDLKATETVKLKSEESLTGKVSGKDVDLTTAKNIKLSELKVGDGGLTADAGGNVDITGSGDLAIKNVTAGGNVTIFNGGSKITALNSDAKIKAGSDITLNTGRTVYTATFSTTLLGAAGGFLNDHPDITLVSRERVGGTDSNPLYRYTIKSYSPIPALKQGWYTLSDNPKRTTTTETVSGADIGTASTPLHLDAAAVKVTGDSLNLASDKTLEDVKKWSLNYNSSLSVTLPTGVYNGSSLSSYEERDELKQLAKALSDSAVLTGKTGEDYNAAAKAWLAGMGYSEAEELEIIDLAKAMDFNNLTGKSLFNAAVEEVAAKYSGENIDTSSIAC